MSRQSLSSSPAAAASLLFYRPSASTTAAASASAAAMRVQSPSLVGSLPGASGSSTAASSCALIEQMRRHTPTRQPFGGGTAFGTVGGAGSFGAIGSLGSHPFLHSGIGTPPTAGALSSSVSIATSAHQFVNVAALPAALPLPGLTHASAGPHSQHAPLLVTSTALGQKHQEQQRHRSSLDDDDQAPGGGVEGINVTALPENGEIFEFE